jgi:hypothetical protein
VPAPTVARCLVTQGREPLRWARMAAGAGGAENDQGGHLSPTVSPVLEPPAGAAPAAPRGVPPLRRAGSDRMPRGGSPPAGRPASRESAAGHLNPDEEEAHAPE